MRRSLFGPANRPHPEIAAHEMLAPFWMPFQRAPRLGEKPPHCSQSFRRAHCQRANPADAITRAHEIA